MGKWDRYPCLSKAGWLCVAMIMHSGQWPKKLCVTLKRHPYYKVRVSFKRCVENSVHIRATEGLFSVKGHSPGVPQTSSAASQALACWWTYICGSHKGGKGAHCPMPGGALSIVWYKHKTWPCHEQFLTQHIETDSFGLCLRTVEGLFPPVLSC